MKITLQHIAANANPMFHNVCSLGPYILYTAHNHILIHNPETLKTTISLNLNHSNVFPDKCNCIESFEEEHQGYIVGGYSTGHIAVFRGAKQSYDQYNAWKTVQLIKQSESIIMVKSLKANNKRIIITLNNKAQLIVYQFVAEAQLKELQIIRFPLNKIPQSIDITIIQTKLLMAIGGIDQLIHCYCSDINKVQFEYSTSLKGHENAITKLAFNQNLLASSSKDGYIRIWKISPKADVPEFQKSLFQITEDLSIYLQSILISHQTNVTNLTWGVFDELSLVSVSWDCTINVWQHDTDNWVVKNRLGQLYGNKNAFFGILVNSHKKFLMSINFTGASCIWYYDSQRKSFQSKASFNGHYDEVRGIEWSKGGQFLVSASKDQTTRVIAKNSQSQTYHEISRAQIHGYDINCVTLVKQKDNTIDFIACGADEKMIRVIEPPANVANFINYFTGANLHLYFENQADQEQYILKKNKDKLEYITYTEGGTQVLGLMTKAQPLPKQKITSYYEKQDEDEVDEEQEQQTQVTAIDYNRPPTEDYMVKHTLWPQVNKLYGHPYQMNCLCVSYDGRYLASNCRSLTKDCAFTLIWDTKTWKILHTISNHKSTVNDICFSKDGHLLTVSKDRTYGLFNRDFNLVHGQQIHTRTITSGHISADSNYFVTGSRDKTIKVSSVETGKQVASLDVKQPVHAVRFSERGYYIAVGTQNGSIIIFEFANDTITEKMRIQDFVGHSAVINGLRWKQRGGEVLLASCSNDHTVRIYKIDV